MSQPKPDTRRSTAPSAILSTKQGSPCACAAPARVTLRDRGVVQRCYCVRCGYDIAARPAGLGSAAPAFHLTTGQYVEKCRGHLKNHQRDPLLRY